jgi:caa(3)-type oxidase subunit IV
MAKSTHTPKAVELSESPMVANAKTSSDHGHDHHDSKAHERHYVKIWALLVGLLVVSVIGPIIGEYLEGTVRFIVVLTTAFGIALVKAYYVVKHFMHLTIEPKYVGYLCATALAFMGLFFFFVAPDVMKHEGRNWSNVAAQSATAQAGAHATEFEVHSAFEAICAQCHGAEGRGDGVAAASLTPRPANFREASFWTTRTRESVIQVITHGGASIGKSPLMAGYGASYTEEQIAELADLVVSFRPEPEVVPPVRPNLPPEPEEPEIVEVVPVPAGPTEADQRARAEFIRQRLYQN